MREVIVVEGKNDYHVVKRAIPDAEIIITSGFGLNKEIIERIRIAQAKRGVIVLTDPDHMGEIIRKKVEEYVPGVKHCFIARAQAVKEKNIGIENASPETIKKALQKIHTKKPQSECHKSPEYTIQDLIENNLTLSEQAQNNRDKLGAILGIGYGNTKTFLSRLNTYGVTREEFNKAVKEIRGENSE